MTCAPDHADAPVLKAPFPAFGGKSRIADLVWLRLGDVRNFIEPFAFSAAVLLRRPVVGAIETINDSNCFVANFWRAVQRDQDAVAAHADWPVNEADLHARHRWLVHSDRATAALRKVREDPDYSDARIAGWWCWGACMWIGSGWCDESHRNSSLEQRPDLDTGQMVTGKMPHLDAAGRLVHSPGEQLPDLGGDGSTGRGVHSSSGGKRPRVPSSPGGYMPGVIGNGADGIWGGRGSAVQKARGVQTTDRGQKRAKLTGNGVGCGVHAGGGDPDERRPALSQDGWGINVDAESHRPQLADAYSRGRGVHGRDELGTCAARRMWLTDWMRRLCDRLRPVRVCCGHWKRVCDSDSTLTRLGTTGLFLDPPYRTHLGDGSANRARHIYANDRSQDVNALCDEVQEYCLKWGGDRGIRIILCGLEGEYPKLDALVGGAGGWEKLAWKGRGGYGNRTARGKENAARERLWLSPHCEPAGGERTLFCAGGVA